MTGIEFNFQLNNKECIKSGYILNKKYINPINYDEVFRKLHQPAASPPEIMRKLPISGVIIKES